MTPEKIELALRRLRFVADLLRRVPASFEYPRDPRDEKFIELAIAGHATHIVTTDKDLLCLSSGHNEPARRFRQRAPSTRFMEPATFLDHLQTEL